MLSNLILAANETSTNNHKSNCTYKEMTLTPGAFQPVNVNVFHSAPTQDIEHAIDIELQDASHTPQNAPLLPHTQTPQTQQTPQTFETKQYFTPSVLETFDFYLMGMNPLAPIQYTQAIDSNTHNADKNCNGLEYVPSMHADENACMLTVRGEVEHLNNVV